MAKAKAVNNIDNPFDGKIDWKNSHNLNYAEYNRRLSQWLSFHAYKYGTKDIVKYIVQWMEKNGYDAKQTKEFTSVATLKSSVTAGSIARMLSAGGPDSHPEFMNGRSHSEWLHNEIKNVLSFVVKEEPEEDKKNNNVVDIQTRMRLQCYEYVQPIEIEMDKMFANPSKYKLDDFTPVSILKDAGTSQAHARIIRGFYEEEAAEFLELAEGTTDEDLKEAYSHYNKPQQKKVAEFFKKLLEGCDTVITSAKAKSAPRRRKPVPPSKIVAKLKYKKDDTDLKLKSVNPVDIVGAKEIYVYNTKTRKLGRYVADEFVGELSVKGTTIVGFTPISSIQKTLRKPAEQLKEFMTASKPNTRKFLDSIKTVDIKLNGRINPETLLLKVLK